MTQPLSLTTMDKLSEIIHWKKQEIADRIRPVRERELSVLAEKRAAPFSFAKALAPGKSLRVIAEIKRRSPSAGVIKEEVDVTEQARVYYNGEADALSILTDQKYFGGCLQDLWAVSDFMASREDPRPCLRKDFFIHPIQIVEAAEAGASAILLIVRALDDETIKRLFDTANLAGLDSLFEIHSEMDLERALKAGANIIGINNRDLTRFTTDLAFSERLVPQIPQPIIRISESGIHSCDDAARVHAAGAHAVLIGEALMRTKSPAEFIQQIKKDEEYSSFVD